MEPRAGGSVSMRSLQDQGQHVPDIVAISLQDQEYHRANGRKRQIRQAGLVVQAQAQAGVELADLGGISARHGRVGTRAAAAAKPPQAAAGYCAVAAGGAVEIAAPCALGLRVLQRRRAAGGGDGGGREGAARDVC